MLQRTFTRATSSVLARAATSSSVFAPAASITASSTVSSSSASKRFFSAASSSKPLNARGTLVVVSSPQAPKAIGPYSQGIKANGFLFVSGCLGIEPVSGEIRGDVVAQTKQAMENMKAVLEAGSSSFSQVAKTTILLADMADFPKVNEAYAAYFPANPPARATFAVKGLPKGGLVEIEAVAVHN